jgi:hypothetical protein
MAGQRGYPNEQSVTWQTGLDAFAEQSVAGVNGQRETKHWQIIEWEGECVETR